MTREETLEKFKFFILEYKNFSVVRFNDGELQCANEVQGENCDGHPYSSELGKLLKESLDFFMSQDNVYLTDPIGGVAKTIVEMPWIDPYFFDILRDTRYFFEPYLNRHPSFKNFIDSEGLHHRINAMPIQLRDFVNTIRNSRRRKLYVGPKRMEGIINFIDSTNYTFIPENNCFDQYEIIKKHLKESITNDCIAIITAGMMTKPLIMELIKHNPNGTYLDFGSSFDPMFYEQTRTGQPTMQEMKDFYGIT